MLEANRARRRPRLGRSGSTALEYALIAGLISILCVAWALSVGSSVSWFFTEVANGF